MGERGPVTSHTAVREPVYLWHALPALLCGGGEVVALVLPRQRGTGIDRDAH